MIIVENSTAKLNKKKMDMIVANNLKVPGAGFGVDTNVVTIITREGAEQLPLQSKDDVAMAIVDHFCLIFDIVLDRLCLPCGRASL